MGSPSKRTRIFSDDEQEEGDELQALQTKVDALNREVFALKAQLKDVKTENRALQQADSRLTDAYYTLKEDSETHRQRDRRVIRELNEKLAKYEKRAAHSEQAIARERDMAQILDSYARTVEHTVTDVAENIDGTEDAAVQCAICLEAMTLQECASLTCGHFFHIACTMELVQDSEIPCPHCRKPTKKREVLQKLFNFDAGWEQLVQLADKWKRMSTEEDATPLGESEEELDFDPLEATTLTLDDDVASDYMATDQEEFVEGPAPATPPSASEPEEEEEDSPPPTPTNRSRAEPSSAQRRKRMEDLARQRAGKRRL